MIHCSAKSNVAHNFLRMKEGRIYAVKNFVVVPNKDEYRIFKQDMFMLEFDGETTIRKELKADSRYRLEVVADDTASTVVVMFNDTTTELIKCSAKSLMVGDDEGANAYSNSNLPTTIRNLVGMTHVLEIKSHTYYEYGSFESFTCWKINPSDPVDDDASSSTPTLTADEASSSFK
nr:hypothetical protein [Tanacetum cinerariifolium]